MLREAAHDKKLETRKALSKDEDDLIAEGKALSQADRDKLQTKLEAYFAQHLRPSKNATKKDVFGFQARLLAYVAHASYGHCWPVLCGAAL